MYNPGAGQLDSTHEYVELYNAGSEPANASGFTLEDEGSDVETLEGFGGSSALIPAGGYAVVTDEDSQVRVPNGVTHLTVGDNSIATHGLKNDGETLTLRSADGSVLDSVRYFPELGADGNGMSLERLPESSDFTESLEEGGSPGEVNSVGGTEAPQTETTIIVRRCSDGTRWGQCTGDDQYYCRKGDVIENCKKCGCPTGLECVERRCMKPLLNASEAPTVEEGVASTSTTSSTTSSIESTSTSLIPTTSTSSSTTSTLEAAMPQVTGAAVASKPNPPSARATVFTMVLVAAASAWILRKTPPECGRRAVEEKSMRGKKK